MKRIMGIILLLLFLGLLTPAGAVLINRGTGMIYDTNLGITWLQDANYAQTSGYDADGLMSWENAVNWADHLSYGGLTNWRLPDARNFDGSGPDSGYDVRSSELGHMWHNNLGGQPGTPLPSSGSLNEAPFQNVQRAGYYWSGTEYSDTAYAWGFGFGHGSQSYVNKPYLLSAWAVHDGDYGPSVSEGNPYSADFITLSDTFSFDYFWLMEEEPTNFNFDLMVFYGGGWEMLGGILNFRGSSDDWSTFSMIVPVWARGLQTQIRFVLADLGQATDPTVYLRNIASNTAPVPEPASMLLFGTGLVVFAVTRRFKKA